VLVCVEAEVPQGSNCSASAHFGALVGGEWQQSLHDAPFGISHSFSNSGQLSQVGQKRSQIMQFGSFIIIAFPTEDSHQSVIINKFFLKKSD